MPRVKFKLLKIPTILLILITIFSFASPFFINDSYAHSEGGLDINWGVPSGDPIFTVEDFKPCDVEKRKVTVKNTVRITKLMYIFFIRI